MVTIMLISLAISNEARRRLTPIRGKGSYVDKRYEVGIL